MRGSPSRRGRVWLTRPAPPVLKACPTVEDARETVASLLSPATETPTIEGVEYPRPRLVIMGGGFTPDDFTSVYETVDGAVSKPTTPFPPLAYRLPWRSLRGRPREKPMLTRRDIQKSVPWVRPASSKPGSGPPPADVVALKVRSALDEHRTEINEGKGAGEIWWM